MFSRYFNLLMSSSSIRWWLTTMRTEGITKLRHISLLRYYSYSELSMFLERSKMPPCPSKSIRTIWTPLKMNLWFRTEQPGVAEKVVSAGSNRLFAGIVSLRWRAIKLIKVDFPVPTFPSQPITQIGRFGSRRFSSD